MGGVCLVVGPVTVLKPGHYVGIGKASKRRLNEKQPFADKLSEFTLVILSGWIEDKDSEKSRYCPPREQAE